MHHCILYYLPPVNVPKLVTVPPNSNRPPEKVKLPHAIECPLASNVPVETVKVPSISEAPATVIFSSSTASSSVDTVNVPNTLISERRYTFPALVHI